jgi:hypothetical protein
MAVNDELLGFVKDALARGIPRAAIEDALRRAGWSPPHISGALAGYADLEFPVPIPRPRPYWSAREAFLYLLLFSTLYLSAYHFGSLLFTFIERAFPDPAMGDLSRQSVWMLQRMRWSIASLLIATPVFLLVSMLTGRDIRRDPSKRDSKVRRWLTYLTLFVAATILIGDFITLVYYALGGELTPRFVLKTITVGGIAGAVFGYYLWDLNADERGGRT